MPELPEVETVRRGLAPGLVGRRIAAVDQRRADLRFPFPEGFAAALTGARVQALGRRGKYLLARLDTDLVWISHLGMTGRFTLTGGPTPAAPGAFYYAAPAAPAHTHLVLRLEDGGALAYADPRRFGYMDLAPAGELACCRHFAGMGPEPLDGGFTAAGLLAALAGRRQSVKTLLLDQRIVAGLGNIYVCEALHAARIAPDRPGGAVTAAEAARLVKAIREVLTAAIDAGGSSLRDFAGAQGALGYFQHSFSVYDRADGPCPRPRCDGVITRVLQAGRSSFFCPRCQR